MNKNVEEITNTEIAILADILIESPKAVLQMGVDGSDWGLYKKTLPDDIEDDDIEAWERENCITRQEDYKMESPDFNFTNDILIQAMAIALKLKIESY